MEISRSDVLDEKLQEYDKPFLRLPILKYLDLLPYEVSLVPPQIALINAVNNPKYRFITAALSRRTGKTWVANIIGHLVTLVPGCNVLLIAPNYSLSQISWDLQKKHIRLFDIETEKINSKDRIIELSNGSTIRMGSISQVDSVVGRSYDLIIFDEAALNNKGEEAFNIQLMPTLDKPNSKCIFISTPRGRNWFYDFWKRGFDDDYPRWVSLRSTWRDNPRTPLEAVEDARKSVSAAEFAQEFECNFNVLEGTVWNFNRECIYDIKFEPIDIIAGLDIGFRDPTAFCVIATDGEYFYVLDEYQKQEKSTSVHAEKIKELEEKYNIDYIYIDSSAQQTRFDLAMDYDIATINADKSVKDGISYVSSIIDHDKLIVSPRCKHTIAALENYRWDENSILEKPLHDKHSHMADALRYALYSYRYNMK